MPKTLSIDDHLHQQLKTFAVQRGIKLQQFVESILRAGLILADASSATTTKPPLPPTETESPEIDPTKAARDDIEECDDEIQDEETPVAPPPISKEEEDFLLSQQRKLEEIRQRQRALPFAPAPVEPPAPTPAPGLPAKEGTYAWEVEQLEARCRELGMDTKYPTNWRGSVTDCLRRKIREKEESLRG